MLLATLISGQLYVATQLAPILASLALTSFLAGHTLKAVYGVSETECAGACVPQRRNTFLRVAIVVFVLALGLAALWWRDAVPKSVAIVVLISVGLASILRERRDDQRASESSIESADEAEQGAHQG